MDPIAVLVVDDEELVRSFTSRALEEGGYTVHAADNGQSALRVLELLDGNVALVLSDLEMPVMNGRELARRLAERWPGVRLLFVSGFPREALEARELFEPAAPFLKKPFLPSRLLETVEDVLAMPPFTPDRTVGPA